MDMDSPWAIAGGTHMTVELESVREMGGQEGSTGKSGPWRHGAEAVTTTDSWGVTELGYYVHLYYCSCITSHNGLMSLICFINEKSDLRDMMQFVKVT